MNLRQAPGREIDRINTGVSKGFSNFDFIDSHYSSNPVLRRIFSLARKQDFESLRIEELDASTCSTIKEDDDALKVRRSDFQRSETHRISFFRCATCDSAKPDDFIGYVIFKRNYFSSLPAPRVHVYESVMPPTRRSAQNNFIHTWRKFKITTSLGQFTTEGVLYAQQNDLTFVCAHVALRSALSTIVPNADVAYSEMNTVCQIDHKTKMVGEGATGLEPGQMESVLKHFGVAFEKVVHEPNKNLVLPTDFQRHIYGAIESGYPSLMGFELDTNPGVSSGGRHVIPVLGHTFNEDTWLPDAQRAYFGGKLSYYPSENWLSTFVVHDDNFGPYLCLPRHFLKKDSFRLLYGLKPDATAFSALEAEAIAFGFCDGIRKSFPKFGNWYNRFAVFAERGWLVLRTVLVKKQQYLDHLRQIKSWSGIPFEPDSITRFDTTLPQRFWLIEASAPELFAASRRKFGDILIAADQKPADPFLNLLLGARLPDVVLQKDASGLQLMPSQLNSHTELFTFPTI
jgi:hypothetical protein